MAPNGAGMRRSGVRGRDLVRRLELFRYLNRLCGHVRSGVSTGVALRQPGRDSRCPLLGPSRPESEHLGTAVIPRARGLAWIPAPSLLSLSLEVGSFRGEYHDPSLEGPSVEINRNCRGYPRGVLARRAAPHDVRAASSSAEPSVGCHGCDARVHRQGPARRQRGGARAQGGAPRRRSRAAQATGIPLDDLVARSLARERFGATLLSVLAALALALTAFGICP